MAEHVAHRTWRARPAHGKLSAMTSEHDHGRAHDHHTQPDEYAHEHHGHDHHGHDHVHDAACEVAHGAVPAPVDGRMLVAVFATPVAKYLLRYAADAGYQPVLVEPDIHLAKEADEAGFDVRPGMVSVPDLGTDVVVTDHHRAELGIMLRYALASSARWVGIIGSPRAQ